MAHIMARGFGWLVLGVAVGSARGQVVTLPAPNISKVVPEDPMTLLAAANRHEFAAADPKWKKVVHWREPVAGQGDSFFEREEDPHKEGTQREERYFDGDSSKPDEYRKFLLFSASGKVSTETDREARKTWNRVWYADGSFASYGYYASARVFAAGVSVRSDHRAVSVYAGGTGAWLRWYGTKEGLEYEYWQKDACLIQAVFDTRCRQLSLQVEGGFLSLTPEAEWLTPPKRDEGWTLKKDSLTANVPIWVGAPAEKPAVLPADEIHRAVEANSQFTRPSWDRTPAVTREQYDARRAEFIAAYTELLKEHGVTWEALGVAPVRDKPLAELPAPDPAWLAIPVPAAIPRTP